MVIPGRKGCSRGGAVTCRSWWHLILKLPIDRLRGLSVAVRFASILQGPLQQPEALIDYVADSQTLGPSVGRTDTSQYIGLRGTCSWQHAGISARLECLKAPVADGFLLHSELQHYQVLLLWGVCHHSSFHMDPARLCCHTSQPRWSHAKLLGHPGRRLAGKPVWDSTLQSMTCHRIHPLAGKGPSREHGLVNRPSISCAG